MHKVKQERAYIQSTLSKAICHGAGKGPRLCSSRQPVQYPKFPQGQVVALITSGWVGTKWVRGSLEEHYLHLTGKGRDSSRHSRWEGLHRPTGDVLAGPTAQDSFRQSLPALLAAERGLCKGLSARRQEWRSRLCNDVLSRHRMVCSAQSAVNL